MQHLMHETVLLQRACHHDCDHHPAHDALVPLAAHLGAVSSPQLPAQSDYRSGHLCYAGCGQPERHPRLDERQHALQMPVAPPAQLVPAMQQPRRARGWFPGALLLLLLLFQAVGVAQQRAARQHQLQCQGLS